MDGEELAKKLEEMETSKVKLEEQLRKSQEALDKALKRVDDAQKKIGEWGGEVGEIRKERDELKKALEEYKIFKAAKEVGSEATPSGKEGGQGSVEQEENPDTIESELNEDQRKLGEQAFEGLTAEEKIRYAKDSGFRLKFLKRLKDDVPAIPASPWKTVKKDSGKDVVSEIDKTLERVFAKKKRASYVPSGSTAGISDFSLNEPEDKNAPPEDSRVH
jgi:hypothetical protein